MKKKEPIIIIKILDQTTWKIIWKEFLSLSSNADKNKFTYYSNASFDTIAGYQEVKEELAEYIDELKSE